MRSESRNWFGRYLMAAMAILLTAILLTTVAWAENRNKPTKAGKHHPDATTVEMFTAMQQGTIAVKMIPRDSKQSKIIIENKTKRPLNVKLPDAFAGVPILAQMGGAGGAGGRGGSSGSQGVGGGSGGGGGMFSIPPESVGKFDVPTFCLDHGKREPRAAVPYEIKPIDRYTTKSGVRQLCQLFGTGKINQRAAQAAAWHLNCDMSWQQLAAKRLRRANGRSQPYFSQAELQAARQVAASAHRLAKEEQGQEQEPSSGSRNSPTKTSN